MNEVKKELIKVAGDMVTSKERVKQRLLQQQEVKPKKPIRFKVMTAIITICLISFVFVQLLDGEKKHSAQLFNHTQFAYFEDISSIFSFDKSKESNKKEAYKKYEQRLASYYYAHSLGIRSTKDELKAERAERYTELKNIQEVPEFAPLFEDKGLDKYFSTYIEPMLPMMVAEKQLRAFYKNKYPTLPDGLPGEIAKRDAIRYFNAHFAEQAKAFQDELGLEYYSNIPNASPSVGTVINVDGNTLLFVEGAIPEDMEHLTQEQIIKKYQNATWFPLEDNVPTKKGDYVEISSNQSFSDDTSKIERYGLPLSITILDPYVTTKLILKNPNEVRQFLQIEKWQQNETSIVRPPDYSFMLDDVRVDVWWSLSKTLKLHALGYGGISYSQKRSEQLIDLLGIEEK